MNPRPQGRSPRLAAICGAPQAPAHAERLARMGRAAAEAGVTACLMRQDEIAARAEELRSADVVLLARTDWDDALEQGVRAARSAGARVVLDVDEPGFERWLRALIESDACTCPTAALAAQLQRLCKPSHILPESFDEAEFRRARRACRARAARPGDALVRIGCAAGAAAALEADPAAAAALARILRERPQARFVSVQGAALEELAQLDINLAPLQAGGRTLLEAALVDVPTIASAAGPFAAALRDGATGLLAHGEGEWRDALARLVDDAGARRAMGRAAHLDVLWDYGPERHAERLASLLEQLAGDGRREARAFELEHIRATRPRAPLPAIPESDALFVSDRPGEAEVTVVVPLYNYAAYVLEALESVHAQTLSGLDLVVVDDGSSDDSAAIAQRWLGDHAGRFGRALLLRNRRNAGLGPARNAGFAAAETPFVLPLDADNVLMPDFAARCLAALRQSGAAFAYPLLEKFGDESGPMGEFDYSPARLAGGNYIDAMALIRKAAWAGAGGYENVRYGWEDYDLWCRFAERGLYGIRVKEALGRYRVHGSSMRAVETNLEENNRRLVADLRRRHPWIVLEAPSEGGPE